MGTDQGGVVVLWVLIGMLCYGSGDQVPDMAKDIRPSWPTHTACSSSFAHVTYTSCDPLQDIGISIAPCIPSRHMLNLRMSIPLRHSIRELYVSVELNLGGEYMVVYKETLCLPEFPRFSFCNRLKGELIHFMKPVKVKTMPSVTGVEIRLTLLNQDGVYIACGLGTITTKRIE